MQLLIILFEILIVSSIIFIIAGIVILISTKGKTGIKYILYGVLGIVMGLIIGFGTCFFALNENLK